MLLQDLRYAARTLLKYKGFTAIAVICLALGIGVNATIFSVVDGIMLQPYPYPAADRLMVLNATNQRQQVNREGVSYKDYQDWRGLSTSFEMMAAFQWRSLTLSDGRTEPERFSGLAISGSLFDLLGARAVLGRTITAEDDRPGAEPVVLLSDMVWRNRYNADPSIVGRSVLVNAKPHVIVGVMPPRFEFATNERAWVPLDPWVHDSQRNERGLQVFARLRPDVTAARATQELAAITTRLATSYPKEDDGWGAAMRPISEWMLPAQVKLIILTMMGAVTLVLLIACANVANLLLARASVRHREIALRTALGAGRWRIVRQLLTEAVMIGALSAPLGAGVAWIGVKLFDLSIPPDGVPYFIHWALDVRSLAYTMGISLLTGIVFGVAPALQAARADLQESLKEGGRGSTGGRARLRHALVVVEVALSLVLLVGASLFMRSFLNLQSANGGFDTAPLMTARFYLPGDPYVSADAKSRRVEDIVSRIESLPGVDAAFASNLVPLGGGGGGARIVVEGKATEPGKEPFVGVTGVTPHLVRTLGIALVRGRDFTDAEGRTKSHAALINQAMAHRFWPEEDAVGRRFRLLDDPEALDWFNVVGVAADFRHGNINNDQPPPPAVYVPYPYEPALNTGLTIRVAGDPASFTAAIRQQIRESDANIPLFNVRSMEELRRRGFWQDRLFGWTFLVFGAIALVLASIGVYGVLSYSVSQRTQEIGLRMALGAGRRDVFRMIVGHGLTLALIGIGTGIIGAFGVTRLVKTLLYNVTPTDPISFAGVAAFLAAVACLASFLPARRATAVDPLTALRNE
jgi:putative ABC transport system permease protein